MSRQLHPIRFTLMFISILLIVVNSQVIDDFNNPLKNNVGGNRSLTTFKELEGPDSEWDVNNGDPTPGHGIDINSYHDLLMEMIAPANKCFNVTGKALKIKFHAWEEGLRTIMYLQSVPNHRIDTTSHRIRFPFPYGENHVIIPLSDFQGADLALGKGFGIEGPLVVRRLELVPDASLEMDRIVFDLREPTNSRTQWEHGCIHVPGLGYRITSQGALSMFLPRSIGKFLKIQYSSTFLGTRPIVFSTDAEYHQSRPRYGESIMEIMFNRGVNKVLVVPLPSASYGHSVRVVTFGLIVYGPLEVHQVELLSTPPPSFNEIGPGDSMPDALLMDDFSDWTHDHINTLNLTRNLLGTKGTDFVSLYGNDEYLVEHFAGTTASWDLNTMAFRITYTCSVGVSCEISLIPEREDEFDRMDELPVVSYTLMFQPGTKSQLMVPISDLIRNNRRFQPRFIGLVVHGPKANGDVQPTIILHRIEIMSCVPYDQPMDFYQLEAETHQPVDSYPTFEYRQFMELANAALGSRESTCFNDKLNFLDIRLLSLQEPGTLELPIRRDNVLLDAAQIMDLDPLKLRNRINVTFSGEKGDDQGGVTREFFSLLAWEINNSSLFTMSADVGYALQINPSSDVDDHINQFRLIGRIVGMAIFNKALLGVRFVPLLYTKILTKESGVGLEIHELVDCDTSPVDISALNAIDPVLYTSLMRYLEEDITQLPEMTMTVEHIRQGKLVSTDLVKDGSMHLVTEANKNQYVREYARWHLERKVEEQANALRDGVWEIVPQDLLSLFTEDELELLISGHAEIDLDDWMVNTSYEDGYHRDHPSIELFWDCVRGWNNQKRSRFLRFVTGSARVPGTGFAGLTGGLFTIVKVPLEHDLPKAYTCFNVLHLPPFPTPELMRARLDIMARPDLYEFGLG